MGTGRPPPSARRKHCCLLGCVSGAPWTWHLAMHTWRWLHLQCCLWRTLAAPASPACRGNRAGSLHVCGGRPWHTARELLRRSQCWAPRHPRDQSTVAPASSAAMVVPGRTCRTCRSQRPCSAVQHQGRTRARAICQRFCCARSRLVWPFAHRAELDDEPRPCTPFTSTEALPHAYARCTRSSIVHQPLLEQQVSRSPQSAAHAGGPLVPHVPLAARCSLCFAQALPRAPCTHRGDGCSTSP